MCKEILILEPQQVELRPHRQEPQRRLEQLPATLAFQHAVEAMLQGMQVEDVAGRVRELLIRQFGLPSPNSAAALSLDPNSSAPGP